MMRALTATMASFAILACGAAGADEREMDERIANLFEKHGGATGTLVIYDPGADRYYSNDFARAEKPFIPASTFKVPHAIIALETGAVANSSEVNPWVGVKRGWDKWDRDAIAA